MKRRIDDAGLMIIALGIGNLKVATKYVSWPAFTIVKSNLIN